MSDTSMNRWPNPTDNGPPLRSDEGGLRAPAHYSTLRKMLWWFYFVILVKFARLRFIAILAAVGAVIVYWETLHAYYDKWTRPFLGQEQAAASNIEFWCPMHPTIIREQPDKCPICGMPLSQRKKGEKGEEESLPAGILSRVQLTPYRVAQASVQTTEIAYQPLTKEIKTVGFVDFDERRLARITARVTGKSRIDKLYVNVTGQTVQKGDPLADLYSPELVVTVRNLLDARSSGNMDLQRMARDRLHLWGINEDQIDEILRTGKPITHVTIRSPIGGYVIRKYQIEGEYVEEGTRLYDVADLESVWIQAQVFEDELAFLRVGLPARATTSAFPARTFPGEVALIQPTLDRGSRTVMVRFDMRNPSHELRPGMYTTVTLDVPASGLRLLNRAAAEEWAAGLALDTLAGALAAPAGPHGPSGLVPALRMARQQALLRQGLVLAVPERAVIDTGSRKVVYREYLPNVFDGVLVELGPRMVGPDQGVWYPVVRGLEAGDKVVTTGSFLVDAETRLTAGVGSTYFGASGGSQGADRRSAVTAAQAQAEDEEAMVKAALGKLSTPDRRLAEAQGFCPVLQDNRLGSMGVPIKVIVKGEPVFLCCVGCKEKALANPDQTLARVEKAKARTKGGAREEPRPAAPARPALTSEEAAEIREALGKLNPEDRRLAEAQVFCAVIEKNYVGAMGTPFKVMVKGQPVFLCCESCEGKALADPDRTLAKVKWLKARAKAAAPGK